MNRLPSRPLHLRFLLRRDDHDITLREGAILIGSSPTCSVVLEHPSISMRHARLTVKGDGLTVTDLRSQHGVFVNGVRLTAETSLRSGDLVTFGELVFGVLMLEDDTDEEDMDGPTRVDLTSPFAE
jgi:pSer/pThr/pTyr-binding forkhead associated (FHA) protein